MKTTLPRLISVLFCIWCNFLLAHPTKELIAITNFSVKKDSLRKKENEFALMPLKICACQVLQLQSLNHKPRNYALFAERTNRKTYAYDLHKAKWALDREKRHLADFFYDKLNVLDDVVETTDCRSLFAKMKSKHSTLILYDILDADLKR